MARAFGYEPESTVLHPSMWLFASPAIAVTYANTYGRFSVKDSVCGFSFAGADASGVDGRSILPILRDPGAPFRELLLVEAAEDHQPQLGVRLDVEVDGRGNVAGDGEFMSTVPGVFVAGDVRLDGRLQIGVLQRHAAAAQGLGRCHDVEISPAASW